MARFGGVHEERRRAGRGKGRGDLAPDMAGLAEPGDDQPSLGIADQLGRGRERRAEVGLQCRGEGCDAACFGIEGAERRLNGAVIGAG
ncbi:hypothetical protein AB7M56_006807 [Bradyrhizobium elkanii]